MQKLFCHKILQSTGWSGHFSLTLMTLWFEMAGKLSKFLPQRSLLALNEVRVKGKRDSFPRTISSRFVYGVLKI